MNLGLTTKAMIGNRKILIALKTCREVDFIFKETSHFKIFLVATYIKCFWFDQSNLVKLHYMKMEFDECRGFP